MSTVTLPARTSRGITPVKQRPRLGFLGVGWIGRKRLEAIAESGRAEVVAVADPVQAVAEKAAELAPQALVRSSLDDLVDAGVDGIVIATPSALHAEQAIAALKHGVPVFCQKPLGRNGRETRRVIQAAREADLLLGVDLSYRHVTPVLAVRDLIARGELGEVYAADLMFHNAYGPDKPWFYERKLSGGGCVIDLGIHLVDLALWMLDFPKVTKATSRLFSRGEPLIRGSKAVEDYAVARLDLGNGATAQIACSWRLPAGCDAIIKGAFYGTRGGASFHNVDGSFYHFAARRFQGTHSEVLPSPAEDWGGKAALHWVERLAHDRHFDPAIEELVPVSATLDAIYRQ